MQRYKDKSVHARGQAGAGRVHPELPAPARHGHPHARPMDIHSRVYMLGGGRASLGTVGQRWGRAQTNGFAYIRSATQPLGGSSGVGIARGGAMDLRCQSLPSQGLMREAMAVSPCPSGEEVRSDRLGWAGHQLPPNFRTL